MFKRPYCPTKTIAIWSVASKAGCWQLQKWGLGTLVGPLPALPLRSRCGPVHILELRGNFSWQAQRSPRALLVSS